MLIAPASVRANFQTKEEKYDHIKGRECFFKKLFSCLSIYMLRGFDVIVILQAFKPMKIVSINIVPREIQNVGRCIAPYIACVQM